MCGISTQANFIILLLSMRNAAAFLTGCTAPFMLPTCPFVVVWNHPSYSCASHGVHLDFEKWGIVDNSKDSFIGDQISLLYRPGRWPYFVEDKAFNGGIPQMANTSLHLEKLKAKLHTAIPAQNFSGLGVIDFEKWRPLYDLNFDKLKIYQEISLDLARKKHPGYNQSQILAVAIKEFDSSARSFMESSLEVATANRPEGQWGYYGFPRCWDPYCNRSTIDVNDRLGWLYAASSALYPSIYFDLDMSPAARTGLVTKIIVETLRVSSRWCAAGCAILPYAQSQAGPYKMFDKKDLHYSVKLPADMGSSGVILWGNSKDMRAKNECLVLQSYITSTLGPFSKKVTTFFSACAADVCSGHGRCVRKEMETIYRHHLKQLASNSSCLISSKELGSSNRETMQKTEDILNTAFSQGSTLSFNNYVCRCLAGWSGPHCDRPDRPYGG